MKGSSELEDRKGFLPRFQPYPLGVGNLQQQQQAVGGSLQQHQHQHQQGSPVHHYPAPPPQLHHPPQNHGAGNRDTPPSVEESEVDGSAMVLASPPHPLQQQQPPAAPSPDSSAAKKQKKTSSTALTVFSGDGGDGATIEVVRRPRGRPPGSKNKPKPPVVITREATDSTSVMRPHILEIPAGHDVVNALSRFSRRRDLGLSVLAATGPVSNVTLRQPQFGSGSPPSPAANTNNVTFHGRFDILSVSATFFPPSFSSAAGGATFSISLAGPHGQIVGGCVPGPLVAAGTVTVVAAAFTGPTYHQLPVDEELAPSVSPPALVPPPSATDASGRGPPASANTAEQPHHRPSSHPQHQQQFLHHQQQQQQHRQLPHHHQLAAGALTGDHHPPPMPISSSHLLSDVIWAPVPRPPHHHQSPYQ